MNMEIIGNLNGTCAINANPDVAGECEQEKVA